jgi:hypothetical protein
MTRGGFAHSAKGRMAAAGFPAFRKKMLASG